MNENTLVLIKPDAYSRALTGTIIRRFEQVGLTLEQIRISRGEVAIIGEHYPRDDQWLSTVGGKTLADHEQLGISARDRLGTDNPIEIGLKIRQWLVDFLQSGPIVPIVLSGNRAIETVRKVVGNTLPVLAAPGTIRGDYSSDSTDLANDQSRPVRNLVHASGDHGEAIREISLWFPRTPFFQ